MGYVIPDIEVLPAPKPRPMDNLVAAHHRAMRKATATFIDAVARRKRLLILAAVAPGIIMIILAIASHAHVHT